jgi:hypothetical protein
MMMEMSGIRRARKAKKFAGTIPMKTAMEKSGIRRAIPSQDKSSFNSEAFKLFGMKGAKQYECDSSLEFGRKNIVMYDHVRSKNIGQHNMGCAFPFHDWLGRIS